MRICGIICEYNPFHNGHAYHLQQARIRAEADVVVCIMSGHFTQRGEPALLDKWQRAQMALEAGADVVLELPTLFAVRPAEQFAWGGVSMLHALGADALAFGCEVDDLPRLTQAAQILAQEPPPFRETLRDALAQGVPHPQARMLALTAALPAAFDTALLKQPNCALALCYLRALHTAGSTMTPILIPRSGAGYHDAALSPMASATAIRIAVAQGQWSSLRQAMPAGAFDLLTLAHAQGALHVPTALDIPLLALLRSTSTDTLSALCDVSEGIQDRIAQAARLSGTRTDLLARAKCKRYTYARLSRILCAALLGITRAQADATPVPPYGRLLGFRHSATPLIRRWRQEGALPIVTKLAGSPLAHDPCMALDIRATDLWALGASAPAARSAGMDYRRSPVRMPKA